MELFGALGKLQKLKNGQTVNMSYADVCNLIINLQDAKKNLNKKQFDEVFSLFTQLRKTATTKYSVDLNGYYRMCEDIILRFDEIAPYEKYSGTSEFETSLLMKSIRGEKHAEEASFGSDEDENRIFYAVENAVKRNASVFYDSIYSSIEKEIKNLNDMPEERMVEINNEARIRNFEAILKDVLIALDLYKGPASINSYTILIAGTYGIKTDQKHLITAGMIYSTLYYMLTHNKPNSAKEYDLSLLRKEKIEESLHKIEDKLNQVFLRDNDPLRNEIEQWLNTVPEPSNKKGLSENRSISNNYENNKNNQLIQNIKTCLVELGYNPKSIEAIEKKYQTTILEACKNQNPTAIANLIDGQIKDDYHNKKPYTFDIIGISLLERLRKTDSLSSEHSEIELNTFSKETNSTSRDASNNNYGENEKRTEGSVCSEKNDNITTDKYSELDSEYGKLIPLILNDKTRVEGYSKMEELFNRGYSEAGVLLGQRYSAVDREKAKRFFSVPAEENNAEALWGLANCLVHNYVPQKDNKNDQEWVDAVMKAAQLGCPDAMNEAGNIENRLNNFYMSAYWYGIAELYEHPQAIHGCKGIAKKWVESGRPDIPKDFTDNKLYQQASYMIKTDTDDRTTAFNNIVNSATIPGYSALALFAAKVFEMQQNNEAAARMYQKATLEGDLQATRALADMLMTGTGCKQDSNQAFVLYEHAAKKGNAVCCFVMGELERNNGNIAIANMWYAKSFARGYNPAIERVQSI